MVHSLMKLEQAKREQFHLFNTFFFKRLVKTVKGGPDDLQELSKTWDRNVKLFNKKYLVVPVCTHDHWLLVIICFPSKVPAEDDPICVGDSNSTSAQGLPSILIFDSLRFKYLSKFCDPFRKFLQSRWKYERPNEGKRLFIDRMAFRDYTAKVPTQRNQYDCGIFMLHFFREFIKSPKASQAAIIKQKELRGEWVVDASEMRDNIKKIILKSKQSLMISHSEVEDLT